MSAESEGIMPKKTKKKIDQIIKGVLIYWCIFVALGWITYWIMGSVPDTLIQYGLGGGAIELVVSAAIEISRDMIAKKEDKT